MIIRLQVLPQIPIPPPPPQSSSSLNFPKPTKNPVPNSRAKLNPLTLNNYTQLTTTTTAIITADSGLRFREKLLYLHALRVNIPKALQKNPNFRSTRLASLKSVVNCLSSMGIEQSALARIFGMHPQLLTCDPYVHLYPVFDFLLHDVEIPFPHIRTAILRCPRLLVCSVEDQLKPTLCFLRELGFVGPNAINPHTTLLLVSSVNVTILPKLEYLMGLGFECEDVVNMVLRSPGLLTFSIPNNFVPKVEYFLGEMNGDLAELKRFPQYFSFSLERKIKPRHQLLVEHGFSLSLAKMLKVSDGEFNARLIEMQLRLADRRR